MLELWVVAEFEAFTYDWGEPRRRQIQSLGLDLNPGLYEYVATVLNIWQQHQVPCILTQTAQMQPSVYVQGQNNWLGDD